MDNQTQGILPDYVINAREESSAATDLVGQLAAGSYSIKDRLEKVIKETVDYNKDIIDLRASALSDYLASPAVARARYNSPTLEDGSPNPNFILNPFEANKAIATDIQTDEIPFLSLNQLLGMRTKGDAELLNSAVGGYQAQVTAAQYAAEAARQTYSDVLNEFKTEESIRMEREKLAASKAGSGKAASAKRFAAIQDAVQGADDVIAAMQDNGIEVTPDTLDQVYGRVFDQLRAQGIDVSEEEMAYVSGEKGNTRSAYQVPEASYDEDLGFTSIGPGAQASIAEPRSFLGRISDFLGIGGSPVAGVGGDINLPSNTNLNLQRGMGVLDTFNDQFDYSGSPTYGGSARLR